MHVSGIGWVSMTVKSAAVSDVTVLRAGTIVEIKLHGKNAGDNATISLDADLLDRVVAALQAEKVCA